MSAGRWCPCPQSLCPHIRSTRRVRGPVHITGSGVHTPFHHTFGLSSMPCTLLKCVLSPPPPLPPLPSSPTSTTLLPPTPYISIRVSVTANMVTANVLERPPPPPPPPLPPPFPPSLFPPLCCNHILHFHNHRFSVTFAKTVHCLCFCCRHEQPFRLYH